MNDHTFLISVLYSCIAGTLGTGLGGLLAYGIKPSNTKLLSLLMSFSAGVMLAVVIFSLVPESLEMTTVWIMLFFIAVGAVFMMFCENTMLRKPNASAGCFFSGSRCTTSPKDLQSVQA